MQKLKKKPLLDLLADTVKRVLSPVESLLGPLTSLPMWLVALAWLVPLVLVIWIVVVWFR